MLYSRKGENELPGTWTYCNSTEQISKRYIDHFKIYYHEGSKSGISMITNVETIGYYRENSINCGVSRAC